MKSAGILSLILVVVFCAGCIEEPTVVEVVEPLADSEGVTPEPERARRGAVVHRVAVGGADICEAFGEQPGCDANFSLVAIEYADGSVTGEYEDVLGQGFPVHIRITCLNVIGNEAWISGVTTAPPSLAGIPVITRVVDNGTSTNDAVDQIGFSNFFDPTSCTDAPDLEDADLLYPLFDLPTGQVKVR